MKKITILLITLATGILTSCNKEGVNEPTGPIKKTATSFTSTKIQLDTEKPVSPTGKTVQRGTLFAWISNVIINTKSLDFNYAAFDTNFQLVDNNNNGIGDNKYQIDNVAYGMNHFSVSTTTSTTPELYLVSTQDSPTTAMANLKAKAPYAIYSVAFDANVHSNGELTPNQTNVLTTQNGKLDAVFSLDPALSSLGVTAKLTATTSVGTINPLTIIVQGGSPASFLWNSTNSVVGQNVSFKVELMDIHGAVFKTLDTVNVPVVKSTAVNNTYVIQQTGLTLYSTFDEFTAEPWNSQDGGGTIGG